MYTIDGVTKNGELVPTNSILTKDEEDGYMRKIDTETPPPVVTGYQLRPISEGMPQQLWFTIENNNFAKEDWANLLKNKRYVYFFVELRYLANGSDVRVTEGCSFVTVDFPAVHVCQGHKKVYTQQQ